MDKTVFKPTAYRYQLKDGRKIDGEAFINGVKVYVTKDSKGNDEYILGPGTSVECLDADFSSEKGDKIAFETGHDHKDLEYRIIMIEERLDALEGKKDKLTETTKDNSI